MAWYRAGTIAVTNGSTAVVGTSTQWIANANRGEGLLAPDGRLYEIAAIESNASITLASAYLGSTASGQAYAIAPTQSYIRDLAAEVAALVTDYGTLADGAVRFDTAQSLTTEQATQARDNIGFVAAVRASVLTGLTTVSSAAIAATDTVIGAFQKLQAQITANLATLTGHTSNTSNPHSVTKSQVGLGNVDNTSDANKPISTATQTALDAKFDKAGGTISGNLGIITGNLVIGTAGKGVDFAASGGTVLDDYEEGTFTPTLNSASGSVSTVVTAGSYTKVGNLVTFNLYINFNIGTASGALSVGLGALPAQKTGTAASTWPVVYSRGFIFPANTTALYAYKYPANSNALLTWQNITGAGGTQALAADLTGIFGSMEIMVSGSYLTD